MNRQQAPVNKNHTGGYWRITPYEKIIFPCLFGDKQKTTFYSTLSQLQNYENLF